jgi:hypothetical protein
MVYTYIVSSYAKLCIEIRTADPPFGRQLWSDDLLVRQVGGGSRRRIACVRGCCVRVYKNVPSRTAHPHRCANHLPCRRAPSRPCRCQLSLHAIRVHPTTGTVLQFVRVFSSSRAQTAATSWQLLTRSRDVRHAFRLCGESYLHSAHV